MLSFIYRLVRDYEANHGYRPNLLSLNPSHYRQLCAALPIFAQQQAMSRFLGMRLILSDETLHPHVSWSAAAERESA